MIISKHIEIIKDERKQTLEQYFTKSISERNSFNDFLDHYLEQMEELIQSANNSETIEVPFIFIGCDVEVEDLDTKEIINYHLTDPIQERIGDNDVSYLSPVGRSLLLKKTGDIIKVKTRED